MIDSRPLSLSLSPRRNWIAWAAAAYAGILVVVVGSLLLLYRGARERLDEALGLRLQAAATTAVHLVDGDAISEWSFDPEPSSDLLWLASRLERIRLDNDLAEITLCDADGFVVASASGRTQRGEPNVYWDLDRPAVTSALQGITGVTHLYRIDKIYQKSAHAPVHDALGAITAVLTVEGNADFFDVLATLRHGATASIITVTLFLGLMGWLLLRIYRSLERARADLTRQERLAAMGRMTAGIAHEIRNPLGIIRGAGQHLDRVLKEHGIEDETATYIPEEVDRLDRILTGYLSFGSDGQPADEVLDLARLLRRTLELVDSEMREAGIAVSLTEPLPPAVTRGDPRRLQQVLLNLLLNARDAMPSGGPVTIELVRTAGRFEVRVLDAGTGLGDTAAEKLFEPFVTTKTQGSGLGLAVSRRIAAEHGGDLTLSNRHDGPGCVAVLALPARQDDGAALQRSE